MTKGRGSLRNVSAIAPRLAYKLANNEQINPAAKKTNPTFLAKDKLICFEGNGRSGRNSESTSKSNTSLSTIPAV